jgi:hypothetical protein
LKRQIASFSIGLLATTAVISGSVSAQADLQNSGGGLQSPSSSSQQTSTELNQTGGLQNVSGQETLSQSSGLLPLGVVSNPEQATPDAIAQPSSTLKTDLTTNEHSSGIKWWITILLALCGVGLYFATLRRKHVTGEAPKPNKTTKFVEPQIIPEPLARPSKKTKKSRRQRRNQTQK